MNASSTNLSSMNLRKAIALISGLGVMAALVACGGSSTKTTPPATVLISANSGYTASAAAGASFGAFSVTVTSNSSPATGVSVTFTAPQQGASGTFATNPAAATDTETTNSSGVATSQIFTGNTTAGSYAVTAMTSGTTTAASFNLTNKAGTAANLAATGGNNQSVAVGGAYASLVAQVTDSHGNPVQGVAMTFTVVAGGTGAGGTFTSTSSGAESVNTDASGKATVSDLVANATTGAFTITAAPTTATLTPPSVTFGETNTANHSTGLAAGNYVFSVQGTDSGSANCVGTGFTCTVPYVAAGVFTVNSGGTITIGEMSFSDFNYYVPDGIAGGSVTASPDAPADTNLIITINTNDPNIGPGGSTGKGTGTLVFNASMASSTRGLISEYDSWASGTGELNFQPSVPTTACAATPCGFAFTFGGMDPNAGNITVGGVAVIDGAGGISGTGSVFDVNDTCASLNSSNQCVAGVFSKQVFSASTVTTPDSLGYVVFTMNSGLFNSSPGVILDGYMIDSSHIRIVEAWLNGATGFCNDAVCSTTGGTALGQSSVGKFSTASVSGSTYVAGMSGADVNGVLQTAGALAFKSGGTMGGVISYNDIVVQNAQGGTPITGGTWTVDSTGRATVTGATDGTALYDLQLYLTGDGYAMIMSMDAGKAKPDVMNGISRVQASGLGVSSLNGTYALALDQFSSGVEFNRDGSVVANVAALTVAGFTDENESLLGQGTVPDKSLNATYSGSATSSIISITGKGGDLHTLYLVDGTQGVVIENDNGQLTLGYAANQ